MNTSIHDRYMSLALHLAEQGRLTVSPNPMVGCVIVKNNQIIGQGFHQHTGNHHAEVLALQQAGREAKGSSVYVTLEPCCHYGRTPPCATALIEAGVDKVYVSCLDPNPLVSGKGIQLLQSANIDISVGLFEKEAAALNEVFFHYITHKKPFVIAKWAMSLDGKTSTNKLDDKEISGDISKHVTHKMRQQVDAILVGQNTILIDNPQLTSRNAMSTKQPVRIVLAGKKKLPVKLNIFTNASSRTLIVTTKQTLHNVSHIKDSHVDLLIIPENNYQQINLPVLLDELAKLGISSLLVEGGMTVHQSFLEENLVNKIYVYLSPKLIGLFSKKKSIQIQHSYKAGEDFHFIANLKEYLHV